MNTAMQKPRVLFSSPYHQGAKRRAELSQAAQNSQDSPDELNGEGAQDNSGSADEGGDNEKIDGIMLSLDDDEKVQLFDTLNKYFVEQESGKKDEDEVDISDLTPQEEA